MNYRVWEDHDCDESGADTIEADSPEHAAEVCVNELDNLSHRGSEIEVNVSAQSVSAQCSSDRVYWTVSVRVEWEPLCIARKAVRRDGAP